MNEVGIIINGVRYDAVEKQPNECCVHCHLYDICDDGDYYNQPLCDKFSINRFGYIFKKSTKSFERWMTLRMNSDNELVKVSTYAKEKGVSVQAIYKQIAKGKLQSTKIDGVWFLLLKEKRKETSNRCI